MKTFLQVIAGLLITTGIFAQGGTSCNTAATAALGVNQANNSLGEQWFEFTVPSTGIYEISSLNFTDADTYLYLYTSCTASFINYNDDSDSQTVQSFLEFNATAGETYYIMWDNRYTSATYNWTIINTASGNADPILINPVGNTTILAGFGYLTIYLPDLFYDPDGDTLTFLMQKDGTATQSYIDGDYLYIFELNNGTDFFYLETYDSNGGFSYDEFYFVIYEEASYGLICTYPRTASVGINYCDNSLGDQWFEFVVPETGAFEISSCGFTTADTYIHLNTSCFDTEIGSNDDECNGQSKLAFTATAGEVYYIWWDNLYTSEAFDWSITQTQSVNTEPLVLNPIGDITVASGFTTYSINLADVFYDADGEPLIYTLYAEGSSTESYIEGDYLYITELGSGNNYFSIEAADTAGGVATDDFYFNITELSAIGTDCSNPYIANLGYNTADNTTGEQWFVFTPTLTDVYSISTCGQTAEDTYLKVYDACNTSFIFSNDDFCGSQSELALTLTAGQSYYILWDNNYTSGNYDWIIALGYLTPEGPQISNEIADIEVPFSTETYTLDLSEYFSNATGDIMYNVSATPDNIVSVTVNANGELIITTADGGSATITVEAYDNDGNTVTQEFSYSTSSDPGDNQAPTVNSEIADINLRVGFDEYTIDISSLFTDAENDDLLISVFSQNELLNTTNTDSTINVFDAGETGSEILVVAAMDAFGRSVSSQISITVEENNVPVIIGLPEEIELTEGFGTHTIDLSTIFNDADGDALSYGAGVQFDVVGVSVSDDGLLTITENTIGGDVLTITVTDGTQEIEVEIILMVLEEGNNAPSAQSHLIVINIGTTDTTISLNNYFSDPDGDYLFYADVSNTPNSEFLIVGQDLEITMSELGKTSTIDIIADDSRGGIDYASFEISTMLPGNTAPAIDQRAIDITINTDNPRYTLPLSGMFSDVDGDELTISIDADDPNIANIIIIDSIAYIRGIAYGDTELHIRANDGNGGNTAYDINLIYINTNPPVQTTIEETTNGFSISPTIATKSVYIQCDAGKTITVFDTQGITIYHITTRSEITILDISNLAAGIYAVKIDGETARFIKK